MKKILFYLKKSNFNTLIGEEKTVEEFNEYQWYKVKEIINFAYFNTKFYKERFDSVGAHPSDIKTFDDVEKLPIVTRDDILEHYQDMLAHPVSKLIIGKTGGSSGHPLTFYSLPEYKYLIKPSLVKRIHNWIGAEGLKPVFHVWGVNGRNNVPNKINAWQLATKNKYCYAFNNISLQELEKLAGDYIKVQPQLVYGYVSLLRLLAQYLIEKSWIPFKKPRVIFATAETLSDEDRNLIENGLGGPVYNIYGSHENGFIASECKFRNGLHVFSDHVFVEVLDKHNKGLVGEPGFCTVTDLDNWGMPFIRYRNEDIVELSADKCHCGRSFPVLKAVYGRDTDFIFDKDYYAYPGVNLMRMLRSVADDKKIKQMQILQENLGEITILAIPGSAEILEREDVIRTLEHLFKNKMRIDFQYVDSIKAEPSGKTRFIKSLISFGKF